MEIFSEQIQSKVPITVLHIKGDIDGSNYLDVIAKAQKAYNEGARHLVLDLNDTAYISSAGLVALQSIVKMLHGEKPIDPEAGWEALHSIGREPGNEMQSQLKLLNLKPRVDRTLELAGMKSFLPVYTDLDAAIASFA